MITTYFVKRFLKTYLVISISINQYTDYFVVTFYSCMNVYPIILGLCFMLSKTYYAQDHADIIGLGLTVYII